jgi:hypothetical protein
LSRPIPLFGQVSAAITGVFFAFADDAGEAIPHYSTVTCVPSRVFFLAICTLPTNDTPFATKMNTA